MKYSNMAAAVALIAVTFVHFSGLAEAPNKFMTQSWLGNLIIVAAIVYYTVDFAEALYRHWLEVKGRQSEKDNTFNLK